MKTISSKDNKLIKLIGKLNSSSKERKKNSLFIAEGKRIVDDAIKSNCSIEYICCSESFFDSNDIDEYYNYSTQFVLIPDILFNSICDTKSPQGIFAVIKILDKSSTFDKMKSNGKYILLENLQNPDNIGTIIRTAEAFGIDGIIMTKDCCDIYNPKVVRGSMGGIFRIPFFFANKSIDVLDEYGGTSYCAVLDEYSRKLNDISFEENIIVCVGNEGNGLKKETIDICNNKLYIPMYGSSESLNAGIACGIIMWEMIK